MLTNFSFFSTPSLKENSKKVFDIERCGVSGLLSEFILRCSLKLKKEPEGLLCSKDPLLIPMTHLKSLYYVNTLLILFNPFFKRKFIFFCWGVSSELLASGSNGRY